jgi:hypothetical protein
MAGAEGIEMFGRMAALAGALGCLMLAGAGSAEPIGAPAVYTPTAAPLLQPVRVIKIHVYTCTARSRVAYGVATSGVLATARRGALYQCAVRTPRGLVCLITRCR